MLFLSLDPSSSEKEGKMRYLFPHVGGKVFPRATLRSSQLNCGLHYSIVTPGGSRLRGLSSSEGVTMTFPSSLLFSVDI